MPQQIFSQIDVFALMAIPLFILVGELMNRGGVTKVLIDLSTAIVGRVRGGLGYVNVVTAVFFSGISGSAVVDQPSSAGASIHYIHDQDDRLLAEYDATGALYREYLWLDDLPIAVVAQLGSGPEIWNVHTDHL